MDQFKGYRSSRLRKNSAHGNHYQPKSVNSPHYVTIHHRQLALIIIGLQTLDNGTNVIQLETAVGAAIKSFEGALGTENLTKSRIQPSLRLNRVLFCLFLQVSMFLERASFR